MVEHGLASDSSVFTPTACSEHTTALQDKTQTPLGVIGVVGPNWQ